MDPVLSQAIATLIGAIATAILLFATSMWGPNSRRQVRRRDKRDEVECDEGDDA
jgi:hypothetical protein